MLVLVRVAARAREWTFRVISIESIGGFPARIRPQAAEKSGRHSSMHQCQTSPRPVATGTRCLDRLPPIRPNRRQQVLMALPEKGTPFVDRARARKPSFGNDAGKLHERPGEIRSIHPSEARGPQDERAEAERHLAPRGLEADAG